MNIMKIDQLSIGANLLCHGGNIEHYYKITRLIHQAFLPPFRGTLYRQQIDIYRLYSIKKNGAIDTFLLINFLFAFFSSEHCLHPYYPSDNCFHTLVPTPLCKRLSVASGKEKRYHPPQTVSHSTISTSSIIFLYCYFALVK